jgi:hypothetical protein
MKKTELIVKSREAMMAAVQLYNNPQITFKTETFITLAIIAWTYLLHAYYANKRIDYRYFHMNGKRKIYDRTKHGAYKHWELERCLDDKQSPIDSITIQNLKFLIGLRHEIEHQMTKKIDASVSAKLQACSINYNFYIKKLFGNLFGVDQELGMVIQFSPIEAEQKGTLLHNEKIADNVKNFITTFEDTLTDDEIGNTHYAYRVVFARIDGKRVNGETDEVIKFLPADSPQAQGLNAKYALIKELEKKKYLSKDIVNLMRSKGYDWFNAGKMTSFWKNTLKSRDKYGVYVTNSQWMWYENWIPVIEKHCQELQANMDCQTEKVYYPKDVVEEMKKNGYSRFNKWWFNRLWEYELQIDKDNTDYGYYDKYHQFVWKESILPLVLEFCQKNATRLK